MKKCKKCEGRKKLTGNGFMRVVCSACAGTGTAVDVENSVLTRKKKTKNKKEVTENGAE